MGNVIKCSLSTCIVCVLVLWGSLFPVRIVSFDVDRWIASCIDLKALRTSVCIDPEETIVGDPTVDSRDGSLILLSGERYPVRLFRSIDTGGWLYRLTCGSRTGGRVVLVRVCVDGVGKLPDFLLVWSVLTKTWPFMVEIVGVYHTASVRDPFSASGPRLSF